jgi:hypothetical protein
MDNEEKSPKRKEKVGPKAGQVIARANQAIAEQDGNGENRRFEKGEEFVTTAERVKVCGALLTVIPEFTKAGESAICQTCGERILFTGDNWKHDKSKADSRHQAHPTP